MRFRKHISSKGLRLGVLTSLAVGLAMALPQTAAAHYVYQSGWLYYSGSDCSYGYSEVSHGTGNGYSKSRITVSNNSGASGSSCSGNFYRPAGYIRIRQIFMAQLAPGWGYCRDTGNLYNTYNTYVMEVARTHNGKCGTTNYQTQSIMHELNGSWKGGSLWSGNHWL